MNRPPTLADVAGPPQSRKTLANVLVVPSGGMDADGDPISLLSVGSLGPGEGTASVNTGNVITWTPSIADSLVAMSGSIVIPFTVSDGRGGTGTAKLTIPCRWRCYHCCCCLRFLTSQMTFPTVMRTWCYC